MDPSTEFKRVEHQKKSTTYGTFLENIFKAITISNASKWVSIYFDYTEKSNGVASKI